MVIPIAYKKILIFVLIPLSKKQQKQGVGGGGGI